MGKAPNGLGKFSGKVGGVVFAISNGEQIVRAYQPVVNNPKTSLQSAQRAKGNLTGRISSFVPRTAIMGMGRNNRMRRGEFLRNVLNRAVTTASGDTYKAKIDPNDVLFSRGSVVLSVVNPTMAPSANYLQVSYSGASSASMPAEEYASKLTRIVVMVYDLTTQELVEVVTRVGIKPAQNVVVDNTLYISHPAGYIADVYLIPMSTADGSTANISTSQASKNDDEIAADLSVNGNAIVFEYGKSVYAGSATFTPAP